MTVQVELEFLPATGDYNVAASYAFNGGVFSSIEWDDITPIEADPLRFAQLAGSDHSTSDGIRLTIQA